MTYNTHKTYTTYSDKSGFNRVELVIFITLLIISSAWTGIVIAREKRAARDTQRISDIRQIQNSIERYFAVLQSYPPGNGVAVGLGSRVTDCTARSCAFLTRDSGWTGKEDGSTLFGSFLPRDPSNPPTKCDGFTGEEPCQYTYYLAPDGNYQIYFYLEEGISNLPAGHCVMNKDGVRCMGKQNS